MQRTRMSTKALFAVGLAGAIAADASVALANPPPASRPPSEDRTTPKAPETAMPAKEGESRPGPLDVVVQFQGTSSTIDVGANAALDSTAAWLKEDPVRSISIEVHPGDAVRADLDATVVQARADGIKNYLVAQGVVESQIRIVTTGAPPVGPADRNHRAVFLMAIGGSVDVAAVPDSTLPSEELPPPTAERIVIHDPAPLPMGDGDPSNDHLLTPFGMAITVGGGLVGFLDDDARQVGNTGGAWEARLTLGTRTPFAFEAAYVGSAQSIDALGLDSSAVLVGTAVEGDVRFNFTTTFVQPYVFGGIGYTRYDVTNSDFNTSSVNDSEEMGHIPFGAGLGFQWRGLLFDVRGTMRAAFNDDLLAEPSLEDDPLNDNDTRTDLDTWSAAARVGWEF